MTDSTKPRYIYDWSTGRANPVDMQRHTVEQEPRVSGAFRNVRSARRPVDDDMALTYSVYWSCVRLLSETISYLPWQVYERVGEREVIRRKNHPVERLIHVAANEHTDAGMWRMCSMGHLLTWGNAFSEIERDGAGRPYALHLIGPERVALGYDRFRNLIYEISNPGESNTYLHASDVLHICGLGFDGLRGYAPLHYAAHSVGSGLGMDEFAESYLVNGTKIGGVLKHPKYFKKTEEAQRLVDSFARAYGGTSNAYKVALLEHGIEFEPLTVNAVDAQLIESRRFQAADVCRFLRVPPHMIYEADKSSYNSDAQAQREWIQYSLAPWVDRFERAVQSKLIARRGRRETTNVYTKINLNALLKGQPLDRARFYEIMMRQGAMTINEARAKEDWNPLEGGDDAYVQLNTAPLHSAAQIAEDAHGDDAADDQDSENDDTNRLAAFGKKLH